MKQERSPQLRVCIVADNASFRFGGEASLPLHYFLRLRERGVEAWLILHERTKAEVVQLLPNEQDRIFYLRDRWYHKLLWKLSLLLPRRIAVATLGTAMVLINQVVQRRMLRKLIPQHGINLVHQPIPVSPKMPSLISGLGVPVIIGPMNGGMDYPPAFQGQESSLTHFFIRIGRSLSNLVNLLIPGKRRAKILLVANSRTKLALPHCPQAQVIELPENGVDLNIWAKEEEPRGIKSGENKPATSAKFIFAGRLVDWKRLDLVIDALALIEGVELEVIGDGAMREAWEAHAQRLGVADRVHFLGWLPQAACASHLRSSIALVLPSIYECGGAVVLEAMAAGIPAIATAWGGPPDYLNADCGILIEPTSPQAMVSGFVEGMRKLAADRELAARMGAAGRLRVEAEFDWQKKIDRILEIYTSIV
jgi:glycosyltransferase involved in cell wall biosynthesis